MPAKAVGLRAHDAGRRVGRVCALLLLPESLDVENVFLCTYLLGASAGPARRERRIGHRLHIQAVAGPGSSGQAIEFDSTYVENTSR